MKIGTIKGDRDSYGSILLVVEKSGVHQLSLVVYPIIYRVYTSQVVQDFSHQQYQDSQYGSVYLHEWVVEGVFMWVNTPHTLSVWYRLFGV